MSTLATAPPLVDVDVLPLQQVATGGHSAPQPMQPMELKPLEPMQMQMGMLEQTQSAKRFCSQGGHAVDKSDRFCCECGNRLS